MCVCVCGFTGERGGKRGCEGGGVGVLGRCSFLFYRVANVVVAKTSCVHALSLVYLVYPPPSSSHALPHPSRGAGRPCCLQAKEVGGVGVGSSPPPTTTPCLPQLLPGTMAPGQDLQGPLPSHPPTPYHLALGTPLHDLCEAQPLQDIPGLEVQGRGKGGGYQTGHRGHTGILGSHTRELKSGRGGGSREWEGGVRGGGKEK